MSCFALSEAEFSDNIGLMQSSCHYVAFSLCASSSKIAHNSAHSDFDAIAISPLRNGPAETASPHMWTDIFVSHTNQATESRPQL